ncbi:MAG TPA: 2'-deoxycytidine 5'-triphosphate deaminase [Alphaproteobacteria bacterium]
MGRGTTGVLPYQTIKELVQSGEIRAEVPILEDQFQPASLDLRLGEIAYRVRTSFLPRRGRTVPKILSELSTHTIDLTKGAVLEKGCVYVVPLIESLKLSRDAGFANPKSSTGRLDVFTRLIADEAGRFDVVENGYAGPLYAEIAPRTFSILVRTGSRLNQLRLRRGSPAFGEITLRRLHERAPLVVCEDGAEPIIRGDSIGVTLDLKGAGGDGLVGFRAKKHTDVIDVDLVGHYEPKDFWEPLYAETHRGLILDPNEFYILATRETVAVPPDHAAEMIPYDSLVGEFRVHYAGFFDPGFGYDRQTGASRAVLEVRSHEVPFMLEHGQLIGFLRYEPLMAVPDKLYSPSIGSSYQGQGLALSRHFKPFAA